MAISYSGEFIEPFEDKVPGNSDEERDINGREKTTLREFELDVDPIPGKFDLEHMAAIHRHLFQDVSSHAGVVRLYGMTKDGNHFAVPHEIDYLMGKELPQRLEDLAQSADDPPAFTHNMAELHSTLDLAHPFREGNGRTTRAMMDQIAKTHGYELDFKAPSREQWVEASIAAIHGHDRQKHELFKDIVTPDRDRQRAAFIQASKITAKDSSKEAQEAAVKILSDHKITAEMVREFGKELVAKEPSRPDPSDGWER